MKYLQCMADKKKIKPIAALVVDSLLPLFRSGSLSVAVSGFPVLSIDCKSRSLDVEAKGLKETGLKLSQLAGHHGGLAGLLKASEPIAKKLAGDGWTLTIYEKGSRALTMGCKVSRLTGHIRANPLKLRRLLSDVI